MLAAPDDLWVLDISKAGKLLVSRGTYEERMMVLTSGSRAEQDLSWLDSSGSAALSADGRTLLFSDGSAVAGINYALCLRKPLDSPVVRLSTGPPGLSPDGKWALSIVPTTPMHLILYPTGAGEPKSLETGRIQAYDSATFFPDGKRIVACGSESRQATRCSAGTGWRNPARRDPAGNVPRLGIPGWKIHSRATGEWRLFDLPHGWRRAKALVGHHSR